MEGDPENSWCLGFFQFSWTQQGDFVIFIAECWTLNRPLSFLSKPELILLVKASASSALSGQDL